MSKTLYRAENTMYSNLYVEASSIHKAHEKAQEHFDNNVLFEPDSKISYQGDETEIVEVNNSEIERVRKFMIQLNRNAIS